MIAIDSTLLIYAHRKESPQNTAAFAAVKRLSEGPEPWLLTWQNIHEFIAVVTHPRLYKPPTPVEMAIHQAEEWMASPSVVIAAEGAGYWRYFCRMVREARLAGSKIYDARLAAVGLSHGVNEILTNDSDFNRFELIRTRPFQK